MDANIINPFVNAVAEVMPQLGFQEIKRGNLKLGDKTIDCRGIIVIVGLTKQLKGNVAYNMTTKTAMKVASTMMMGMAVDNLDDLAQSAISEMVNMVTANAAIHLEKGGILADISPPTMIVGIDSTARLCSSKYVSIELIVDSEPIEVNIGIELLRDYDKTA